MGLHSDESLRASAVAGPFHPAFGEMCYSRLFRAKIAEQLPVGRQAHHRPRGHPHLEVVAVRAGLELPPAVLAPACDEPRPVVEVEERGEVLVRDEDHIPSPAAVAAVRTAPRDVFLPAETHAAVPAVARLDQDLDLVYEHVAP